MQVADFKKSSQKGRTCLTAGYTLSGREDRFSSPRVWGEVSMQSPSFSFQIKEPGCFTCKATDRVQMPPIRILPGKAKARLQDHEPKQVTSVLQKRSRGSTMLRPRVVSSSSYILNSLQRMWQPVLLFTTLFFLKPAKAMKHQQQIKQEFDKLRWGRVKIEAMSELKAEDFLTADIESPKREIKFENDADARYDAIMDWVHLLNSGFVFCKVVSSRPVRDDHTLHILLTNENDAIATIYIKNGILGLKVLPYGKSSYTIDLTDEPAPASGDIIDTDGNDTTIPTAAKPPTVSEDIGSADKPAAAASDGTSRAHQLKERFQRQQVGEGWFCRSSICVVKGNFILDVTHKLSTATRRSKTDTHGMFAARNWNCERECWKCHEKKLTTGYYQIIRIKREGTDNGYHNRERKIRAQEVFIKYIE